MRESASLTTWTRSSAGNERGTARARGVDKSRALRAVALRRGWSTPGSWPRLAEYVVARRYAVSGTALGRLVRVDRPTVPQIVSP